MYRGEFVCTARHHKQFFRGKVERSQQIAYIDLAGSQSGRLLEAQLQIRRSL